MDALVADLLERCVSARQEGLDFPTIWSRILSRHRLVSGIPVSVSEVLAVPLATGDTLCFNGEFWIDEKKRA